MTYEELYHDRYCRHLWRQWGLRLIDHPTTEPITLLEAAKHLRLDTFGSPPTYYDIDVVEWQIPAAREFCEEYVGLSLAPKTYALSLRSFPYYSSRDGIELPMGPVVLVQSFQYFAADGSAVTLVDGTDFEVDYYTSPNKVYPKRGAYWPTITVDYPNSVLVTYVAGYAVAGSSPAGTALPWQIRAALLLMLGHLYENREPVVVGTIATALPLGVKTMLDPYRLRLGMA